MPFHHKPGLLPHKRRTRFEKPNDKFYREELMGLDGDKINLAALKPVGRLAGEAMRV